MSSPLNAITLAHAPFEARSVKALNTAIAVMAEPKVLRFQRRFRRASASNTEHIGDEFRCVIRAWVSWAGQKVQRDTVLNTCLARPDFHPIFVGHTTTLRQSASRR